MISDKEKASLEKTLKNMELKLFAYDDDVHL